jgi:hypothetical protein
VQPCSGSSRPTTVTMLSAPAPQHQPTTAPRPDYHRWHAAGQIADPLFGAEYEIVMIERFISSLPQSTDSVVHE